MENEYIPMNLRLCVKRRVVLIVVIEWNSKFSLSLAVMMQQADNLNHNYT